MITTCAILLWQSQSMGSEAMVWFLVLTAVALLMALGDKLWENPLAIFGLIPIGLSFWLLAGVVVKALSLP